MSELSILLSGVIANAVTSWVKPPAGYQVSQESIDARKSLIRGLNFVVGAVMAIVSAWVLGEPLDISSVSSSFNSALQIVITYAFSQGMYHIVKK